MKIYVKTEVGQIAFKTRSGAIPARLRSVFILFDGQKTLSQVLEMGSVLGATATDIHDMVAAGLLAPVGEGAGATVSATPTTMPGELLPAIEQDTSPAALHSSGSMTHGELYARAIPIATRITSELGLRGFRLNLAVESAMTYHELCALVPKIKDAAGEAKVRPLERALMLRL